MHPLIIFLTARDARKWIFEVALYILSALRVYSLACSVMDNRNKMFLSKRVWNRMDMARRHRLLKPGKDDCWPGEKGEGERRFTLNICWNFQSQSFSIFHLWGRKLKVERNKKARIDGDGGVLYFHEMRGSQYLCEVFQDKNF